MTVSRLRPLAVAVVTLIVLGGCAVPGKGEPGVAAEYRGNVITDQNITELRDVMGDELYSAPQAGEDLTLLLVGPDAVTFVEQLGYDLSDDYVAGRAQQWISYSSKGQINDAVVTPACLAVVRVVDALNIMMHDADGLLALRSLVSDIEQNATFSPRYGDFSMENFSASIQAISDYIDQHETELSFAQFTLWQRVNGFNLSARPEWVSSE
jgi:hypothetical protein